MKLLKDILNENLQETLSKTDDASVWIDDFVNSGDPRFEGKSKEKRKEMALAAYYAAQKNEDIIDENKNSPQRATDFERFIHGAMSRDEYYKKYNLGKYKPKGNPLAGPGGLYKNLIVKSKNDEKP